MDRITSTSSSDLYSQVTKRELVQVLELVERTLVISTEKEMGCLLLDIRRLVPCDYIVSALARTDAVGRFLGPLQLVNASYPTDWLVRYLEEDYAAVDPILQANFRQYKTQVWSETYEQAKSQQAREFIGEAEAFDLRSGLTMGVKCPSQPVGSLFSFSGRKVADHDRHAIVLDHLVPHLHQSLMRLTFISPAANPMLSSREREVLIWIKEGKTNWEISKILQISERTVRFHVENVLGKLQASTRGHAVAVALQQGLIAL